MVFTLTFVLFSDPLKGVILSTTIFSSNTSPTRDKHLHSYLTPRFCTQYRTCIPKAGVAICKLVTTCSLCCLNKLTDYDQFLPKMLDHTDTVYNDPELKQFPNTPFP